MAPKDDAWDKAVSDWRALFDERDAVYNKVIDIDCSDLKPQVTWGNSPQDVIAVDGVVPNPDDFADAGRRGMAERALDYMALSSGLPIRRHADRHRLHRLLYQRAAVGFASRFGRRARTQSGARRASAGGPRRRARQGSGGG